MVFDDEDLISANVVKETGLQRNVYCIIVAIYPNGAFTPEQDNDKTTTRQKLNLCISIMPFTPGLSDRCERHNRNAQVQLLSCRCLVVVLLWCESTITPNKSIYL